MICEFAINTFLNLNELKIFYHLLIFMFGLLNCRRSLFKEVNYQFKANESTQSLSKLKTFNINSKFEGIIFLSDWGKVQSAELDILYRIDNKNEFIQCAHIYSTKILLNMSSLFTFLKKRKR